MLVTIVSAVLMATLSLIVYILVHQMDVSYLSTVTLAVQKKLADALFLQVGPG